VTVAVDVPSEVQANTDFLRASGIWHLVSQNPEVRSCRDAADKRWRLGDRGIPLCDELKSTVGLVEGESGPRDVAIHCRGHQQLDLAKVSRHLGGPFRRLAPEELANRFDMQYGTVTPFGIARRGVEQVFDATLLERYFPPYTMMTNLGALTCGVEFEPEELIAAVPASSVADVIDDTDRAVPVTHTLGILTGNSPESGMLLWETINDSIRKRNNRRFRGDVAFPRVIVESVPGMGLSMELSRRASEVRPVVLEAVERLCSNGATVVGIACNTTQYFAPDVEALCTRYGARFVSLAEEATDYLHREGIRRFDFFGISEVSDFGGWSAFQRLADEFDVVRPEERKVQVINEVAFSVKQRGVDARAVNRLRDLVNGASETDTVVIALTELSSVLDTQRQRGEKRFVDTLAILGEAMAELYLKEREGVEAEARP
jgi:aspartate/glutamate racemase/prolyl-tRNA editing enzyme YbaK/EbsC (Cys-tRNA(Pro) deacylase)